MSREEAAGGLDIADRTRRLIGAGTWRTSWRSRSSRQPATSLLARLIPVVTSADEEAVEFLLASAIAKLWKHAYRDEAAAVAQAEAFVGD